MSHCRQLYRAIHTHTDCIGQKLVTSVLWYSLCNRWHAVQL